VSKNYETKSDTKDLFVIIMADGAASVSCRESALLTDLPDSVRLQP
jgi:hypothetical protein